MSNGAHIGFTDEDLWPKVEALEKDVYPPDVMANVVWRDVAWAHANRRVCIPEEDRLICHVGVYERNGLYNDWPRLINGIGGVMTAPDRRRRGLASQAMRLATSLIADFNLLFCEPHNEQFYESLGWYKFRGEVLCVQPHKGRIRFDILTPMIHRGRHAPEDGVIDLCGLPW